MQRILSVYDWEKMEVGEAMAFKTDLPDQRPVRIRVNAPSPAELWIEQGRGANENNVMFLAVVHGLDEIQFHAQGDFTLFSTGGEVWFHTLDGERGDVEPVDDTSFTAIVTRRVRNPEQEIMELRARQNMERILAAQRAEFAAMLAEAKVTNVDPGKTTPAASNGVQQAQSVGSEGTDDGADDGSAVDGGSDGS